MMEEKELIDLMTKMGDAYLHNKTEEGNHYSKHLISKLDFSERRDQEALFQILGNALIRNDEFCVLDMLHERGFDFQMEFQRGGTLTDFFSKYPKFKNDDRVFRKLSEFTGKSLEDELSKKKLQEILSDHDEDYILWYGIITIRLQNFCLLKV